MSRRILRCIGLTGTLGAFAFGAVGQSTQVPLDRWLRHMQSSAPAVFCAAGTPIRLCFSLSAEECQSGMFATTRTCIANLRSELPSIIQLPEQGRKFGGEIGECATDAYAAVNMARYVASESCSAARQEAERAEQTLPK